MAPHPSLLLRRTAAIVAAGCCAVPVQAQTADAAARTAVLPAVSVTTRAAPAAGVAGWGDDAPLSRLPVQASVHSAAGLAAIGATRLADVTRIDPAVTDAYNAVGYWDSLTVRGFALDPRFNHRRDGLPISAETAIPLDNKEAIEILKGVSGLQAGTSAPGGLVNHVVKRPLGQPLRSGLLQWRSSASVLAAVDLSQRLGRDGAFGLRVNAAHELLRPQLRGADGRRSLLAVAADWRPVADGLLEAEFEASRQKQPSQPGFSLLGPSLPAPADPRINLNDQPWSLPVVFGAGTGSLRYTHAVGADWRVQAHWMAQRLRTDDRLAFPFGCSAEGNFDRYCSDGTFDYYAYRSDGERRRVDALRLSADGRVEAGGLVHRLAFAVLETRHEVRLRPRLDDTTVVGTGSVDGRSIVPTQPPASLGTVPNMSRDERSTEFSMRDHVALAPRWDLWAGLRHTRLRRESVRTDGSDAVAYTQSFSTPWLGIGHRPDAATLVYASWARGSESEVVPTRDYTNGGRALPVLRSRQVEVGVKRSGASFGWSLSAFEIVRPASSDDCPNLQPPCTRRVDGSARHRGVEGGVALRHGPWRLDGGAQWLHARREGSADASLNGLRPFNVPAFTLKALGRHQIAAVPGLSAGAGVQHEGGRMVLPDNSVRIPSFTTVSLDAMLVRQAGDASIVWRAGIDNLFDRRAWRESPYQYGHVYLYPLAARSARVSMQVAWR